MRITVVAPYLPTPTTPHAGGRFLRDYLRCLSVEHQVTLLTWDVDGSVGRTVGDMEVEVPVVVLPVAPATGVRRVADRATSALAGTVTAGGPASRALRSPAALEVLRASDVVDLHWSHVAVIAPYIRRAVPGVVVGAFLQDVVAQSLRRRAEAATGTGRLLARLLSAAGARAEAQAIRACDTVAVFSSKDADLVHDLVPTAATYVVEPPFWPVAARRAPRRNVLFVGHLARRENDEGLRWFTRRVWPAVLRSVPDARLRVAGGDPPGWLGGVPRCDVLGFVADLEDEYACASVALAPLFLGAGVKFKVLEAAAHCVPVAATVLATEGISDEPGAFACRTDDPDRYADGVVAMLTDPAAQEVVAVRAHKLLGAPETFATSIAAITAAWATRIPG